MMIYDINEITRIDASGITCIDNNGNARVINLSQCSINWANAHQREADMARCVADRDSTASPMYFLFYSDPQVKVAFPFKKGILDRLLSRPSCRAKLEMRAYREFTAFTRRLKDAGWSSCDLA
jgi:hypothetical protein